MQSSYLQDLQSHLVSTARIPFDVQIRKHVSNAKLVCGDTGSPICVSLEEAQAYIGQEVGVSSWFLISQDQVNRFAEATGDYQYLHIDQERASRDGCFGGTIAHGLLTLSLVPLFAMRGTLKIKGVHSTLIYGMDRVRYLAPLRIGKRIQGCFTLLSATQRSATEVILRHRIRINIEGEERPAMIADWIVVGIRDPEAVQE